MSKTLAGVLNNDYDIELDENGVMKLDNNEIGVASMMNVDFNSNKNWILDERLGVDWFNNLNIGIMQQANNKELLIDSIIDKINSMEYIRDIESMEIETSLDGKSMDITVRAIIDSGEEIVLTKKIII